MKISLLEELLIETNWLRKLWIGGAVYDQSMEQTLRPEPGKEIWLSSPESRLKFLRELSIDLYLFTLFIINQKISRRQALINYLNQK